MKLRRGSRLVRWAYLFSDCGPPPQTSVCVLFWRCVLITPLPFAAVGFFLVAFAMIVYENPQASARVFGVSAIVIGLIVAYHKRPRRKRVEKEPGILWLAGQRIKAAKSKVCPLVEIEL